MSFWSQSQTPPAQLQETLPCGGWPAQTTTGTSVAHDSEGLVVHEPPGVTLEATGHGTTGAGHPPETGMGHTQVPLAQVHGPVMGSVVPH